MDFSKLKNVVDGQIYNPYAGQLSDGTWVEGVTDTTFLNTNFGQYTTAQGMKAATSCAGLQAFFDYLVQQGELAA